MYIALMRSWDEDWDIIPSAQVQCKYDTVCTYVRVCVCGRGGYAPMYGYISRWKEQHTLSPSLQFQFNAMLKSYNVTDKDDYLYNARSPAAVIHLMYISMNSQYK